MTTANGRTLALQFHARRRHQNRKRGRANQTERRRRIV
jgi:hypothetical protein